MINPSFPLLTHVPKKDYRVSKKPRSALDKLNWQEMKPNPFASDFH